MDKFLIWNKLKNNPVILSLLIITTYPVLAYFLFIPSLGFYNDDWLFAYIGHFYGAEGLIKGLAGDRPLTGYLFAVNHILINNNILLWHIYIYLMRLLGGYILFFLLKKLWPNRLSLITSITILYLIYPGFLQQTVPLGYQNYITAQTIWVASLLFTVLSLKNRSKITFTFFTLTALILQLISFLLLEFFIGMEVLRILLIISGSNSMEGMNIIKLKKKIRYWSPYILTLLLFILWRIFIFKSVREATNINWLTQTYYSNPVWVAKIPLKILYGFFSTVVLAYFIPMIVKFNKLPVEKSTISFSLGIISSSLLYFYFRIIQKYDNSLKDTASTKRFGKNLLFIGSISILAALVPVIVSGRFATVFSSNDNYDRYTISSIIGVGFLLVGFLFYKTSNTVRIWVLVVLTALSITTHLMNGYWYKYYWDTQKDIWWQMYWRVPKIKKDALLLFDFPKTKDRTESKDLTFALYKSFRLEDYQIWAPGNLFFNYHDPVDNHFSGQYLPTKDTNEKIRNKTVEITTQESSTLKYKKDFNNTIIISLPSDGSCLWLADRQNLELSSNSSELLTSNITYNITYSDVNNLVQTNTPITPPSQIFGVEPPHTWCYYFQKASLARQLKDWGELSKLTGEVLEKNLKPKDINEWLPFIEGLIVNKQYLKADILIKKEMEEKTSKVFMTNICKMLNRLVTTELEYNCG